MKRKLLLLSSLLLAGLAINPVAHANATIYLKSFQITDGDTIRSGSYKIRLYGIDAPEKKQTCMDANNNSYDCGIQSGNALKALVDTNTVCIEKSKDFYGRSVAVCYNGDVDINQLMVRKGWAVAYLQYSKDYLDDMNYAKKNKLGIWQGKFTEPAKYRKSKKNKN